MIGELTVLNAHLESELAKARERLAAAEDEIRELRARIAEARTHDATLAEAAANLARVRDDAQRRAEEIVEAARADADALRAQARAEVEDARAQVEELLKLRRTLGRNMRSLVAEVEQVVARVDAPGPQPPAPGAGAAHTAEPSSAADVRSAPEAQERREEDGLFDRQIELDAGPFTDFASLSAFERALASLPKVEDVYIRRFEGDRATIDVTLAEPTPLLDDMTERLPYRLDVQSAVPDRISLTVSSAA
ncbi:MAG TPA: hypothetical protein VFA05_09720 [Gaiellaceae bacterium]|nr:hypothetical protein [Gaiellaceae bacterium]